MNLNILIWSLQARICSIWNAKVGPVSNSFWSLAPNIINNFGGLFLIIINNNGRKHKIDLKQIRKEARYIEAYDGVEN